MCEWALILRATAVCESRRADNQYIRKQSEMKFANCDMWCDVKTVNVKWNPIPRSDDRGSQGVFIVSEATLLSEVGLV